MTTITNLITRHEALDYVLAYAGCKASKELVSLESVNQGMMTVRVFTFSDGSKAEFCGGGVYYTL